MRKQKKQVFQDLILISISITLALVALKSGFAHQFVASFGEMRWFGMILAGVFFTSIFTTVPAMILFGEFAQTNSLLTITILGGLGAVLGDYIIFRFVKDRVTEDLEYIFSFRKRRRFFAIFKTRLFKRFVPFIAGLIIASPFPDEIGIAMLGMSKISNKSFFVLSFLFNGFGVLVISWIAKSATGL